MPNFKIIIYVFFTIALSACLDLSQEEFFSTASINKKSSQMEYQDIHKLNLAISMLYKEVDESGFSPKLKSHFQLKNQNEGPWAQAWVAFSIDIYLNEERIASIAKANVLQNHRLKVEFEQHLPKFGISQHELQVRISPIAWMPTFPLQIMAPETKENALSINQNMQKSKPKLSALP